MDRVVVVDAPSLPTSTSRRRYISGVGSSLAYNRQIAVDTSAPTVVKVFPTLHAMGAARVQANPGTFGVGEEGEQIHGTVAPLDLLGV